MRYLSLSENYTAYLLFNCLYSVIKLARKIVFINWQIETLHTGLKFKFQKSKTNSYAMKTKKIIRTTL